MIAPGMLQDPVVRNWLGGVEPAWMLLDQASFAALQTPPSPTAGPIRLASDLSNEELQQSAVTRNALLLLRAAASGPGLKLTATGNLSRKVVAEMRELFSWPGFDKAEAFRLHKVVNEPDFLPLFFVRYLAQAGKLLRRHKDHLRTTPSGRQVVEAPHRQSLQAILFHIALWHLDLSYLGRGVHRGWPQEDAGIILWCLSVAADEWQTRERLTRMCTIPTKSVVASPWDTGSHAMEATILRPLWWFGLLDHRAEATGDDRFTQQHFYRKTEMFDRFLSFDVTLEIASGRRH